MTRIDGFSAVYEDGVTEVREKNENLRAFMKTLAWPRLACFEANGRVYELPLRAASARPTESLDTPADFNLRYLAGFFDGDGSVSCVLSGCRLQVSQSFDKAEVLMLLRETFGGGIGLERNGMGLRKPSLRWAASGQSARRAASLLAPYSIAKRKQLILAAEWPETLSHREHCKAELKALKEYDSAVTGPCSWEYCAGFFDAEGYIGQLKQGVSLAVEIRQKHPQVLNCFRDFLAGSIGIDAKVALVGHMPCVHRLFVTRLLDCKQMLQCMLQAGLLCKAKRAKLALGLTPENALQVNAELACLTGNQMYGKGLDASGVDRAKTIAALNRQARTMARCQELHKAEVMLRKVEALQSEHVLLKALKENAQLLDYCRGIEYLHDVCWEGPHDSRAHYVNMDCGAKSQQHLSTASSFCKLDGARQVSQLSRHGILPLSPQLRFHIARSERSELTFQYRSCPVDGQMMSDLRSRCIPIGSIVIPFWDYLIRF